MKYLVKIFVVTFLLLIYTHASAEQKVAYLDMKFVLNNSKAGKGAQDFLQKSFKENQKKFLDEENALKKKENDLLAQKTILTKEEYQKKSDNLRKKVIDYQSQRRTSLEQITTQRAEARQKLLDKLDPILKLKDSVSSVLLFVISCAKTKLSGPITVNTFAATPMDDLTLLASSKVSL